MAINSSPPSESVKSTTGATFQIKRLKLHVLPVILFKNNNVTFLEHLKQEFKRRISWNKCRSQKQHSQKTIQII